MAKSHKLSLNRCDLDTANTLSRLEANLDVALVTPGLTPRVLHQEVLETVFVAVANNKASVVNVVTTTLVSDHTACILHEHHVIALHSYCNWSFLYGSSQLLWIHGRHIDKISDAHSLSGPVSLATFTGEPLVRIVFFKHDAMILPIPESSIHGSSKASFVTIDLCAVNKLLL